MADSEQYKRMMNTFPRDLLQRFMGTSSNYVKEVKDLDLELRSDSIELNLGLSLGGKFGVEKKKSEVNGNDGVLSRSNLFRSCSGSICNGNDGVLVMPEFGLARTASLPVEMEEEWRKRKEMQSLRRLEAKRRRSEKQMIFRAGDGGGDGGVGGGEGEMEVERDRYVSAIKKVGSSVAPKFGLPMLAGDGRRSIFGGEVGSVAAAGGGGVQGSVESQGGSSSSMSELESKHFQGSSDRSEEKEQTIRATAGACSSRAKTEKNTPTPEAESPSKRSNISTNKAKETGANSLGDMPCVFTIGDGPNGRRIEGILYKYGKCKGEEIRIMCVCHGSFHSPAEFVKHAGGSEVANPLKHIVVNPNATYR